MDILFKPEELKKFASCGVYVLDSPEDLFSIALKYLGSDPDTTEQSKINAAADLLAKMRPRT